MYFKMNKVNIEEKIIKIIKHLMRSESFLYIKKIPNKKSKNTDEMLKICNYFYVIS